jgi:hypothetical protein
MHSSVMLTPYDSALPGTCSWRPEVILLSIITPSMCGEPPATCSATQAGHLRLPPVVLTAVGVAAIDDHPAWLPFVETIAERPLLVTERK